MKYTIEYANSFDPDTIRSFPSNIKDAIEQAIEKKLTHAPETFGKPLRYSLKGKRSLRVGDYRVVFTIRKSVVIILDIKHRSKIYQHRY